MSEFTFTSLAAHVYTCHRPIKECAACQEYIAKQWGEDFFRVPDQEDTKP